MDKFFYAAMLFDFYGEFLTEKQRRAYDMYFNENLSLAEIAGELGITRQGARDLIKRSESIMTKYETQLSLVAKHLKNIEKTQEIIAALTELKNVNAENTQLCDRIAKIEEKINNLNEL